MHGLGNGRKRRNGAGLAHPLEAQKGARGGHLRLFMADLAKIAGARQGTIRQRARKRLAGLANKADRLYHRLPKALRHPAMQLRGNAGGIGRISHIIHRVTGAERERAGLSAGHHTGGHPCSHARNRALMP